jgi:hypothetical protein
MTNIDHYAKIHRTDKASWGHNFTEFYEELFGGLRADTQVKILEFGVKFGSSLRMWEDAFPKATVIGVDNNWRIRDSVRPQRSILIDADLSDRKKIAKICEEHGPFDIVVDDSAHRSHITRNIVETVFPQHLKPGCWLVVEDTNSGYKNTVKPGVDPEKHDQIDYCMGLVKNVNHSGMLTRCGPRFWADSSKFDIAIKEIRYRPGVMAMQRR